LHCIFRGRVDNKNDLFAQLKTKNILDVVIGKILIDDKLAMKNIKYLIKSTIELT
jgi:hypothetical protein